MAGKPELSAAPGVQNVVVYVSNDNFAQAYTVNQNVGQDIHNGGTYANPTHTVAPLGPGKSFQQDTGKLQQTQHQVVEATAYNSQTGYFANQAVIGQNGFPQQQQQHVVGGYKGVENGGVLKGAFDERTIRTEVKECVGGGGDYESSGFVVMGGDGTSVRCDSVRSETAESSCSSLSSADEGMLVVPQPDMVVYDNSVNVRHGVVVAVGGNHPSASASIVGSLTGPVQQTVVPYGWKRLSTNGVVIYISPSNAALSSLDQVKEYLLTPGTCKCGLECPLKFDSVFNFDPKVIGKPWTLSPDTNTGDLTKLCNHKRKIIAMASLGCKPPDPNKLPKDYIKKKKRKLCGPYTNVSVSQILAQREKVNIQHPFNKENMGSPQFVQHQPQPPPQIWQQQQQQHQQPANIQEFQASPQNNAQFYRYQNPEMQNRMDSPVVMSDGVVVQSGTNQNISNQMQISQPMPPQQQPPPPHQHHQQQQPPQQLQHQIIGPNGQILNQMGMTQVVNSGMVIQGGQQPHQQQRVFVNGQPSEPSGPGRPVQMVPVSISTGRPDIVQRMPQPQCFYGPNYGVVQQQQIPPPQFDQSKNIRAFRQTGPPMSGGVVVNQKLWNPRVPLPSQHSPQSSSNVYERVPPLPQHQAPPAVWQDEINRKKFKQSKGIKKRSFNVVDGVHRTGDAHSPCPNVDVRQIQSDGRQGLVNHFSGEQNQSSSPSFIEDPSGYLAQQTALLNSTISRQTGVNSCSSYICNSPVASMPNQMMASSQANGVPLPSNIQVKQQQQQQQQQPQHPQQQQIQMQPQQQHQQQPQLQSYGSPVRTQSIKTQMPAQYNQIIVSQGMPDSSAMNEINCQGCAVEYQQQMMEGKEIRIFPRPSSQPGTPSSSGTGEDPVTSSNYMEKHPSPDSRPIQGGTVSTSNVSPVEDSPDPSTSHTPTPPHQEPPLIQIPYSYQSEPNQNQFQLQQQQQMNQNMQKQEMYCQPHRGVVTTMASGRTVGSNTITSVLAGRANTATVSITNPVTSNQTIPNQNGSQTTAPQVPATKSPLEMVQSVVSSIKVPQSQPNIQQLNVQSIPQQIVKQGLPPGHIFVSSGGQLIMASTNSGQVMPPPPPPKIVTSMPPISVSPMITNVTGSVTQMIPAVAQQVLGQQTVLVNALPAPFVIQPGVTMTMDGMNMQIPHLVTGNVIQQQIQIDNSDPRRVASLLSPENKKKGKKRKVSSQTVASMLHIAAQQNSGVVGFPQQIQMAHSPQGITAAPVMQALTIVPGKAGAPPQLVMNGQLPNTQQIINSQSQQINLLQPVNLAQGMVQNFPTIQQFVLPNLTGMVMNADGTATIVQDTNIGMQLQLQNVNGQNVLTPVQNNQVFTGGQSIIPAGMVIRPQGKIIQQQHSPGAQFLSPNGGGQFVAQFNGQLSPLVANVSPGQQVTFSTAPQPIRPNNNVQQQPQEFIQCGQTLMVPANIAASTSNQQNTTFVQQNTTIVQQQTTMLSNNQGNQNLNVDQNFLISEKQPPVQTVVLQQRQSPQQQLPPNYRHSVSTQTAVNQNGQSVTTNTFCQTSTSSAGSPPDTTTHSPLAPGGQSPPTADTTTHSGSTDDGLSPAPSNCSGSCSDIVNLQRQQQSSMAMVHCISSSEPDSAEMNVQNSDAFDWRGMSMTMPKMEFTEISSGNGNGGQASLKKPTTPTHVAYAESSTMVHFATDSMKQQEAVVSSRNYEKMQAKRKHGDTLVVMEMRHMHSSLFDDDDEEGVAAESPRRFSPGDLVWGPARGCPAWPGKVVEVKEETVTVRWFGSEKFVGDVDLAALRTLTEGLEAHHRAGKKSRTSRKLNAQLEKAIQEAMVELDKMSDSTGEKDTEVSRKSTGRLRSSQK